MAANDRDPGAPEYDDEEATSVPDDGEETPAPEEAAVDGLEIDEETKAALDDLDIDGIDTEAAEHDDLIELTNDLQRVGAEFANYRRRAERERAAATTAGKAAVLTSLLPILDDLDLAEKHGDLAEGPLKAFAEKLRGTATSQGAVAFGAEGEPFDPALHEAVSDVSQGEEKVIGTLLRPGYRFEERVLRTAMVIIGDPTEPAVSDGE